MIWESETQIKYTQISSNVEIRNNGDKTNSLVIALIYLVTIYLTVEFIETRVNLCSNLCSTTLFLKGKKESGREYGSILESRFWQTFRAARTCSKFSPFHTRVLSSLAPFTLLTLVVAHARKLIVMNFVEYTFLLCLRHVLTTLRSPPPFVDKEYD